MYRDIEKELEKFQCKQWCYPLVDEENDNIKTSKEHFIFYCLEVVQWNISKPGQLYLFGKTYDSVNNCYVNCCVTIKYCHQRLYFLPRRYFYNDPSRKVTWRDVFDEVCETVVPQLETQEVHFRKVKKKYAFDEYVPEEGEYLEIKCMVGNSKLKNKAGNTYSKILGIKRNSFIETFLLERNINGPSWLQIANYVRFSSGTNCSVNIECYRIEDVTPIEVDIIPPILLMGLDIKKARNEYTKAEEIICVSAVIEVHSDFGTKKEASHIDHFCIVSDGCSRYGYEKLKHLEKYPHTKIVITSNEEHLLHMLIGKVAFYEPDLLYGHTILTHYIDILHSKIVRYQLPNFHKLSKLKVDRIPSAYFKKQIFVGRVLCDTRILAEEMLRSKTYSIHELATDFLGVPHQNVTAETLEASLKDPERLIELAVAGVWDAICVHKLMRKLNILPLLFEITKLCGNTLNGTCEGLATNRCDHLLMHAFQQRNFIVPSEIFRKPKETTVISGGLVLEPEVGLHKNFVLAMDFKALYPSIIREFNVCFTTLKLEDDDIVEVEGEGVLPQLVANLIDQRKTILQEIGTTDKDESNDAIRYLRVKQNILKKTANSIYGNLGCKSSRFAAEHLANFITAKGREILSETVKLLSEDDSIKVIYGDTDSVMVETELQTFEEVTELSNRLTQAINSRYKHVMIENAGIFKPFYVLRKKKYAAMKYLTADRIVEEIKGLDVIRKDWSGISSIAGRNVLKQILKCNENIDRRIYEYLEEMREDLEENYQKFNIEEFTISKKLNKDPDKYAKEHFEHVNIALKYNQSHSDKLKMGDIVSYIICIDGSSRSALERAYHVEEFVKSPTLAVDVNYYLSNQIYPVVKRICAPLCSNLSGKELLKVLKVNLCQNKATSEVPKKKKKTEKPEPILDPLNNFELQCKQCQRMKLVSYASLDFVKSCDNSCSQYTIRDFAERLKYFTEGVNLSYTEGRRTFEEAYGILVNIRCSLLKIKKCSTDLSSYMSCIDLAREELLKEVNCWNLKINELFVMPSEVAF